MKVAINNCFGGFSMSDKAEELYAKKIGKSVEDIDFWKIERNDPVLIECIEELGNDASDFLSQIKIVEIPDDVEWQIQEYDGNEWVSEVHRTWS